MPYDEPEGAPPESAAVLEQLEKVISSAPFRNQTLLQNFLRFVVTQAVEHPDQEVPENSVGVEIIRRDYNSAEHATVRQKARELRSRLAKYNSSKEGQKDLVRICLPERGYKPTFHTPPPPPSSASPPKPPAPPAAIWASPTNAPPHETQNVGRRRLAILVGAALVCSCGFAIFLTLRYQNHPASLPIDGFSVLLADFEAEPPHALTQGIYRRLKDAFSQYPQITVRLLGRSIPWRDGSKDDRQLAGEEVERQKASLIVWGGYYKHSNSSASIIGNNLLNHNLRSPLSRFPFITLKQNSNDDSIALFTTTHELVYDTVVPSLTGANAFTIHSSIANLITHTIASSHEYVGNSTTAIALWEDLIRSHSLDPLLETHVLFSLGNAYFHSDAQESVNQYLHALEVGATVDAKSPRDLQNLLAQVHLGLALAFQRTGDADKSANEFTRALAESTDPFGLAVIHANLGILCYRKEDFAGVIKHLDIAIRQLAFPSQLHLIRADANIQLGNAALALQDLDTAILAQLPRNLEQFAHESKGRLLLKGGRTAEAVTELTAAIDGGQGTQEALIHRGVAFLSNDANRSETDCKRARDSTLDMKQKARAQICVARSLLQQGRKEDAVKAFQTAMVFAEDLNIIIGCGPELRNLGLDDLWIKECDAIITLRPDDIRLKILQLTYDPSSRQHLHNTLIKISSILDTSPNDTSALQLRINTEDALRLYSQAEQNIKRIETSRMSAQPLQQLYSTHAWNLLEDHPQSAAEYFARALKLPGPTDVMYLGLSSAETLLNHYQECISAVDRGLKLNPNHSGLLNNRAFCLTLLGKSSDALIDANAAIKGAWKPTATLFDTRSRAYLALGQLSAALADSQKALTISPEEPELIIGYARTLLAAGKIIEAEVQCKKVRSVEIRKQYLKIELNTIESYIAEKRRLGSF